MSYRTAGMAYYCRHIKNTDRSKLLDELTESPLREKDADFMKDVLAGKSHKELAVKYNKSISRIAQWKRTCCETLADWRQSK